jgi:hypothetical protein
MFESAFNTAWERHGMRESAFNTAWERHGMCESAFNKAWERHGMCESAFMGLVNTHLCRCILEMMIQLRLRQFKTKCLFLKLSSFD